MMIMVPKDLTHREVIAYFRDRIGHTDAMATVLAQKAEAIGGDLATAIGAVQTEFETNLSKPQPAPVPVSVPTPEQPREATNGKESSPQAQGKAIDPAQGQARR